MLLPMVVMSLAFSVQMVTCLLAAKNSSQYDSETTVRDGKNNMIVEHNKKNSKEIPENINEQENQVLL